MIIPTLTLPLHIIGAIAVGWLGLIVLAWFILDLRYYGKEGFDFRKCRKNNIPYIMNVDIGSGNATGYPAETNKKGPGRIFHKGDAGAKIDPSISMGNDEPLRLARGLDIHIYGTMDAWPTSVRNAAGITKIKEIRRAPKFRALDSIPDKEIMEILDTPDDHLPHDVKLFIEKYKIPNPDVNPDQIKSINQKLDEVMRNPAYRVINWMKREELAVILDADEENIPTMLYQLVIKYFPGNPDDEIKKFSQEALKSIDDLREDPVLATVVSPLIKPYQMLEVIAELKKVSTETPIDPKFGSYRSALKDAPNSF